MVTLSSSGTQHSQNCHSLHEVVKGLRPLFLKFLKILERSFQEKFAHRARDNIIILLYKYKYKYIYLIIYYPFLKT